MNRLLYRDCPSGASSLALLLIRLVTGAAFILHGLPKIKNPMAWMGPDSPFPGALQGAAAVAEFGGGIALIFGVATPLFALLLAATMGVAIGMVHVPAGDPFVNPGGKSWELAAVYLVNTLVLLLMGPGRFSMDACLFGGRKPSEAQG
jgi:putative oxidoreductase